MILGLIAAILIGLSLGLLGAGGAILTVPLLVYLVGHGEKQAIVESLAIVGAIALVGSILAARAGQVESRTLVLYAIPGMVGAVAGAWLSQWVPGVWQLMMLAALMLVVAYLMLRPPSAARGSAEKPGGTMISIAAQGAGIGVLTGLLGVGGGFLLVPSLLLLRRLEMSTAVGTSLGIIALNSAVGLGKHLWAGPDQLDLFVVTLFIAMGVAGMLLGRRLVDSLDPVLLRRGFAVFLLLMAVLMIGGEIRAMTGSSETAPAPVGEVSVP